MTGNPTRTLTRTRSIAGQAAGRERGSASVEAVGLAFPVLALGVLLAVFGFQLAAYQVSLTAAASAAARAASLAPAPQAALSAARTAAAANLNGRSRRCPVLDVTLDASQFRRGGAAVVTLSCQLTTFGLTGLALPGTLRASATSRATIDVYAATPALPLTVRAGGRREPQGGLT